MKFFVGFILFLIVGYIISPLVTPVLLFLIKNFIVIVGNLALYSWYYLQIAWAYIITQARFMDSSVCFLPIKPVYSWGIIGGIIGFVISFIGSVKGRRRSYLKLNLIFILVAVILLGATVLVSRNIYNSYTSRENDLKGDLNLKYIKSADGTGLFSAPSTDSLKLTFLKKGSKIFIESEDNDWFKVKYNSLIEGIMTGFLIKSSIEETIEMFTYGIVKPNEGANIRAGAGTNFAVVSRLGQRDSLIILSKENDWFYVKYEIGNNIDKGYLHKSCVTVFDSIYIGEKTKKQEPSKIVVKVEEEKAKKAAPIIEKKKETKITEPKFKEPTIIPGSMSIERAVICKDIINREPHDIRTEFNSSEKNVVCWMNVTNTRNCIIKHIYYCNGNEIDQVNLNIRAGSRFRTYSKKNIWEGNWSIYILDDKEQLMKKLDFIVIPD